MVGIEATRSMGWFLRLMEELPDVPQLQRVQFQLRQWLRFVHSSGASLNSWRPGRSDASHTESAAVNSASVTERISVTAGSRTEVSVPLFTHCDRSSA